MSKTQIGGEIVEKEVAEYLKNGRNKYGTGWKRSLARDIFKKYPNQWNRIDSVRAAIQYITGCRGESMRSNAKFAHEVKYCNILILDIETAPLLSFCWGIWEQNLSFEQIQSDWFVFTWSAKWLFEKKVYSAKLTGKEAKEQNDKRIMQSVWQLLDKADIVITHNGDKFDIKRLNTRFLIHGMPPPMPYLSIDTLKHNKKQFAHSSNKLDYINHSLKAPRKMEHEGFPMWIKCYRGDEKALATMERYNIKDVLILETMYLRIRNWIKPHPNITLHITDEKVERCPTCGSDDLKKAQGRYATTVGVYEAFRCNSCGAVGRERTTMISRERAKYIKISVAK